MSSGASGTTAEGKIRVKRVGNYIIGKTIGEGSFSKVRVGTHILTNEKVAMKIIDKSKIEDNADIERITREIQILKLIDHPNIIRLYEIIDTPRHIYIVQEFLPNGELFDYIVSHGRLSEPVACKYLCHLFAGLQYLHDHRVIHRDLKPENALLDASYNLKIIDFGLSNIARGDASDINMETACGSPAYASPEMIEGKTYSGSSSDTWSCGIVLYTMLCGCLPFEASTTQGLYVKILSGNFPTPDYLSMGARDVLRQMLCVNPLHRAKIRELVRHPWVIKNWTVANGGKCPPILTERTNISKALDFRLLLNMKRIQFDPAYVIKSLFNGKHNSATATYTLMAEKIARDQLQDKLRVDGYDRTDWSSFEVKRSIAKREFGVDVDSDGVMRARNKDTGELEVIGNIFADYCYSARGSQGTTPRETSGGSVSDGVAASPGVKPGSVSVSGSSVMSKAPTPQDKVTVTINGTVMQVKPETAVLMATMPRGPIGPIGKPAPAPAQPASQGRVAPSSHLSSGFSQEAGDADVESDDSHAMGSAPKAMASMVPKLDLGKAHPAEPGTSVPPAGAPIVPKLPLGGARVGGTGPTASPSRGPGRGLPLTLPPVQAGAMPNTSRVPVMHHRVQEEVKEAPDAVPEYDDSGFRIYHGAVTANTSSTLESSELVKRLEAAFKQLRMRFEAERVGCYRVQRLNVTMTAELCRVDKALNPVMCILMHRQTGDAWVYKELCTQILNLMRLN